MIHSMTAFARFSDQGDWGMATWEIRSVNHRYFDCAIKMPEVLHSLETDIRQKLQQQLHRGRIECTLKFQPGEQSGFGLKLNTGLVKQLAGAFGEIKKHLTIIPEVDPMKILSWPQVLQTVAEDTEAIRGIILQLFAKTLTDLFATRKREGLLLGEIIKNKLQQVLVMTDKIKNRASQELTNRRAKIMERLEKIKGDLDQSRLEQEMVYMVHRLEPDNHLADPVAAK